MTNSDIEASTEKSPRSSLPLELLVGSWPVARSISQHLPVGDLISLSRTNTILRALLHGFGYPPAVDPQNSADSQDCRFLNIGFHDTLYWAKLKELAPVECSSNTHTRGKDPRPCRYCSRPICEACIVRDSMRKGKENTFNNRCRYLCPKCWEHGNFSKAKRFPLLSRRQHDDGSDARISSSDDACVCTLKDHGFLCLECKDRQNTEAKEEGLTQCHGEGCDEPAGDLKERRRVCNWCHKRLPRHLSASAHQEWNEKIIAAKQRAALSRQADMEEYNRKRTKMLRMSRRELRGDRVVEGHPEADKQQFVRHLDTFNYRKFMPEKAMPTGNEVYQSQKGHWTYSIAFLEHIGVFCHHLPARPEIRAATTLGAPRHARTTLAKPDSPGLHFPKISAMNEKLGTSFPKTRLCEWHEVKAHVLDLLLVKCLPLQEVQMLMLQDFHFHAHEAEYKYMFEVWKQDWKKVRSSKQVAVEDQAHDFDLHDDDLDFAKQLQRDMDLRSQDWRKDQVLRDHYVRDNNDLVPPFDDDLEIARELQRQMDREVAEQMQTDIYNAENNEVDNSDWRGQSHDTEDEEEDAHITEADAIRGSQSEKKNGAPGTNQNRQERQLLTHSASSSSFSRSPSSSPDAESRPFTMNYTTVLSQSNGQNPDNPEPAPQNNTTSTAELPTDSPPPYMPPFSNFSAALRGYSFRLTPRSASPSTHDDHLSTDVQVPDLPAPHETSSPHSHTDRGKCKGKQKDADELHKAFDNLDEGTGDDIPDDDIADDADESGTYHAFNRQGPETESDDDEDEVIYRGRKRRDMPGSWYK